MSLDLTDKQAGKLEERVNINCLLPVNFTFPSSLPAYLLKQKT